MLRKHKILLYDEYTVVTLVVDFATRDLWSVTVDVAVAFMFEYRYYVAVKHSQETSAEHHVMVQTWETNIHPRVFRVSGDLMIDRLACSEF